MSNGAFGGKAKFRASVGGSNRQMGQIELVEIEQNEKIISWSGEWVDYDQSRMRNLLRGDVIDFTAIILIYDGLDADGKSVKKAKLTQIRNIERVL